MCYSEKLTLASDLVVYKKKYDELLRDFKTTKRE
jgi:hypothetical protein